MNALRSLFLDSLATRYDAEKRLALAMPAIAKRSTCKDFRELIQRHFKETIGHIKKLQRVFECFATDARTTKSAIMISLLKECDRTADAYKGSLALEAALISCAQKIEHQEIASCGCLAEWAALLGNKEATNLLRDILGEKRAADAALTYLARCRANNEAMGEHNATKRQRPGAIAKPLNRRSGVRPRTFNRIHPVLM
jgi:ferritin-like metal-binding protein YciE